MSGRAAVAADCVAHEWQVGLKTWQWRSMRVSFLYMSSVNHACYPDSHKTLTVIMHGITAADTSLTNKQYCMLRFDNHHGLCMHAGLGQEYISMLQNALSVN